MKRTWILITLMATLMLTAGCDEELKTNTEEAKAAIEAQIDQIKEDIKTEEGRAKIGKDIADAGATVSMIPHPTTIAIGAGMIFLGNLLGKKRGNKTGLAHGLGIATDIVDFVEQQKDEKGTVKFGDETVKKELKRLMGDEHRAVVNKVRGK